MTMGSCYNLVVNIFSGIVCASLFCPVVVQDIVFEQSRQKAVGSSCKFDRNNSEGMCRELRNCPGAIRDFRDRNIPPTTCSFTPDNHPIVCCGVKRRYDAYCNYYYGEPETAHLCFVLASGGTRTKPGEFPHMTAIGWRYGGGRTYWECGGSMISLYYVLTAAHCTVNGQGLQPNIVRIGDENLLKDDGQWVFDIDEIVVHPKYRPPAYYNDIALIKFGSKINNFKKRGLKPVCLPPEIMVNYGDDFFDENHWTPLHALGYGATSFGGPTDDTHLNKVIIDIIPFGRCQKNFPPDENLPKGILNSTQICAGDDKGIQDTCQGDSGGPLQRRFNLNKFNAHWYYTFGVTSFGPSSCGTGPPGVYTRITPYLDWIESIVWPTELVDYDYGTNLTKIFGKCSSY